MSLLKGVKTQLTVRLVADVPQDKSRVQKVPFHATYKVPTVEEAQGFPERIKEGVKEEDLVREYLLGWDMPGEDDVPVEFSGDNLDEALSVLAYRNALVSGLMQVSYGKDAVAIKNG